MEVSERPEHYTVRCSPISAVTIPPAAKKAAKVPPDATFFCYSFPMLPGYKYPALNSTHIGKVASLKQAEGKDHFRLRVGGEEYALPKTWINGKNWRCGLKFSPEGEIKEGVITSVEDHVMGEVKMTVDGKTQTFPNPSTNPPWNTKCPFASFITLGAFIYFDYSAHCAASSNQISSAAASYWHMRFPLIARLPIAHCLHTRRVRRVRHQ